MASRQPLPGATALLQHAETVVNRWIGGSSAARERLRALEGRSMHVVIDKTDLQIGLRVEHGWLRLSSTAAAARADVTLRAGPFELLQALRAESPSGLKAGEIEFRGSVGVAEQFAQMLQLARPSLEDELAGWIGGLPAHALAGLGRAAVERLTAARAALELDTAEYLQAETRELPLPGEVADFSLSVERLRDDVERLAQRIDRLVGGSSRR